MREHNLLRWVSVNPTSIREIVEGLNMSGLRTVFVVDLADRLIGTVTDGDVRRALLSGLTLESPASEVINRNFLSLNRNESSSSQQARDVGAFKGLTELPVLDSLGRLVAIDRLLPQVEHVSRPNTVVLMAGGEGLRLRPLTEDTPKPMLHVGGRPILEHIVVGLQRDGFTKVVIAVNYLAEKIEDHFQDGSAYGLSIEYLREPEPLGTAGPLSLIGDVGDEPFVVMNSDLVLEMSVGKMIDFHTSKGSLLTVGAKIVETTSPYGVLRVSGQKVTGVAEKPTRVELVNAGVYVVNPDVLSSLAPGQPKNMPDLINDYADSGKVIAFPIHEAWADLGRLEDLQSARQAKSDGSA